MTKLMLTTLTVAAMAVAAHESGLSGNWKINCNRNDSSVVSGNPILMQTIQVGGMAIRTKATFSEEGQTLMRGVQVESPIGPIELLYLFDRK